MITLLGVDQHESLDEPQPVPAAGSRSCSARSCSSQIVVLARQPLGHGRALDARRRSTARGTGNVADARAEPVHRLHLGVRDHRGAARDRRRRRRRARPPQRPAPGAPTARREGDRRRDRGRRRSPRPTTSSSPRPVHDRRASGCCVRRNTLVMFMCIELMLNAANLTFVVVRQGAQRHRRPGDRVLHAGRRRGRGGGRSRDHRGHLPAPSERDRRRRELLEGLTRMTARDLLDLAWVIPALPGVRRGRAAAVRQAHRRAAGGLARDRD